jgi:glycosyltransferase involved in cell wall biosynthesis
MADRLRIAQIAPIVAPVGPDSTRSIEKNVSLLADELVRLGHDVTLFATGNSKTIAELRSIYPLGCEEDSNLWDWRFHELMHVASALEVAGDYDVVHSHVYHFALPFTRLVDTPVVHTYHVLPNRDIVAGFARYPEVHIAALSDYQRKMFCGVADVTVIHHGIEIESFPFESRPGDYLLFLGRFIPEKGPVAAIHLARAAGMRLLLAGPNEDDEEYFRAEVAPLIDGHNVEYVGPVDISERNRLLAGAAAMLYPIKRAEPFGLVLIESMACGTPVAALSVGAVPELVDNGRTGHHCADLDSLAASIPQMLALDRAVVRQQTVARFDYRRMAVDYVAFYRRLTRSGGRRAPALNKSTV